MSPGENAEEPLAMTLEALGLWKAKVLPFSVHIS